MAAASSQTLYRSSVHASQSGGPERSGPSRHAPANRSERRRSGMARGGEDRREEHQTRTGTSRAPQVRDPVRRAGHEAADPYMSRPAPATKMHSGPEHGGKPDVPGDDQQKPACPADFREIAPERSAVGIMIVPENDPREAPRQAADSLPRVGQSLRIREQPERRKPGLSGGGGPGCRRPSPGEKPRVQVQELRPGSAAGTPLVVEYSKCSASLGRARGKIACAAMAASLNPWRMSLSLPG